MAAGRLMLWSAAHGGWVACAPDEITWLDRAVLSGNEDVTLHRAPRCAGLRCVQETQRAARGCAERDVPVVTGALDEAHAVLLE